MDLSLTEATDHGTLGDSNTIMQLVFSVNKSFVQSATTTGSGLYTASMDFDVSSGVCNRSYL